MIGSLLSFYKDVINILPIKAMQAEISCAIIKKIIIGLENTGYFVIATVADNPSVNWIAMPFSTKNESISVIYLYPVSEDSPIYFLTDSVHVLKYNWNNWLNQKNTGKCTFYVDVVHEIIFWPITTILFSKQFILLVSRDKLWSLYEKCLILWF